MKCECQIISSIKIPIWKKVQKKTPGGSNKTQLQSFLSVCIFRSVFYCTHSHFDILTFLSIPKQPRYPQSILPFHFKHHLFHLQFYIQYRTTQTHIYINHVLRSCINRIFTRWTFVSSVSISHLLFSIFINQLLSPI